MPILHNSAPSPSGTPGPVQKEPILSENHDILSHEADCVCLAVEYITANYHLPLNVTDLAKYASVSHSSLYRGFLKQFQMPPKRYLMEYRIQQACRLMQDTDSPIGEVAAAVGFDDPFYFSRIFKQLRGMPPKQYAAAFRNPV